MESILFNRMTVFILLSIFLFIVSWKSLHNIHSHGFFRFFAFEGVLALVLLNIPFWFTDPFSLVHLLSWFLLVVSVIFIIQGIYLLKKLGGRTKHRDINSDNFEFENTTKLVTVGLYHYIRHPMYSSLMLLAWGAFFKNATLSNLAIVAVTTALLVATAKVEELENISFFGESYKSYMKDTKLFIPFLF